MSKDSGRITKKIGKAYPDVFHGIKVTTTTKFPKGKEQDMTASTEPGTRSFRLPWTYERRRFVGRCIGAWRVFAGKSASIPKGGHDTAIGQVNISDYYGGCTFSIQKPDEDDLAILARVGRDLYWTSQGYDGSGASLCSD